MMELELDTSDSKEYKIQAIQDSVVYVNKLRLGYLPRLYYMVV